MANLPHNSDPGGPRGPKPDISADLKSIQTLALIAGILGAVSLIIGGTIVSSVAVIIAAIALWRMVRLGKSNPEALPALKELRKTCIFALVISGIALALNIYSFINVYPTLVETFGEQLSQGAYSEDAIPKGLKTWG